MQGMISFNLFVRVFVITLYPTLHKLMGQNCEIISGCFTLGIKTRSVSFAPSDSKPEWRPSFPGVLNGAISKSVVFTSSLEKGL